MIGHVYMVSTTADKVSQVLMIVVYGMSKEYVHFNHHGGKLISVSAPTASESEH